MIPNRIYSILLYDALQMIAIWVFRIVFDLFSFLRIVTNGLVKCPFNITKYIFQLRQSNAFQTDYILNRLLLNPILIICKLCLGCIEYCRVYDNVREGWFGVLSLPSVDCCSMIDVVLMLAPYPRPSIEHCSVNRLQTTDYNHSLQPSTYNSLQRLYRYKVNHCMGK